MPSQKIRFVLHGFWEQRPRTERIQNKVVQVFNARGDLNLHFIADEGSLYFIHKNVFRRYVMYAGTFNSERIGMGLYLMVKEYEMEFREVQAYVFVECGRVGEVQFNGILSVFLLTQGKRDS